MKPVELLARSRGRAMLALLLVGLLALSAMARAGLPFASAGSATAVAFLGQAAVRRALAGAAGIGFAVAGLVWLVTLGRQAVR